MTSAGDKCSFEESETRGIFYYVGLLFVFIVVFRLVRSLLRGLYSCFIGELIGATVNWKKLGKWAVITGGTDGIGKAYAKALASKGFDIVLVSRTQQKLDEVADEIEKKYSVKTKTIAVDVTDDVSIYDKIRKGIEGLDIGVLVNNVGKSYDYAEYLTKVPHCEKFIDDVVKANIISCARTTMLVLPLMEKMQRGVIINISSLSAISPAPLLTVYSAAKVFVNFFSKGIQDEYKGKGVIIQSVLPGFVATKMSKKRPSLMTCTPESYVYWALKTVGIETQTFGYPLHKLQGYAQEFADQYLPESLVLSMNHKILGGIRKKYYKKYGLVEDSEKHSDKKK